MQILEINDWTELSRIEEDAYQLALIKLPHRKVSDYRLFAKHILNQGFEELSVHISPQTERQEIEAYLRDKLGRFEGDFNGYPEGMLDVNDFYTDISEIATSFLKALGVDRIRLQLEAVRENTCTRFHVDYNEYRLLFTYLGKTTEYLFDEDVERKYLGTGSHRIQKKNTRIQRVAPDQIAILKGVKKSPNHALVHKAPIYDHQPRLLLRIDSNPMVHLHHSSISSEVHQ
jgi:hypothetical protein